MLLIDLRSWVNILQKIWVTFCRKCSIKRWNYIVNLQINTLSSNLVPIKNISRVWNWNGDNWGSHFNVAWRGEATNKWEMLEGFIYGEVRLMWAAFGGGGGREFGRGERPWASVASRFAAQLRSHPPWERTILMRCRFLGRPVEALKSTFWRKNRQLTVF